MEHSHVDDTTGMLNGDKNPYKKNTMAANRKLYSIDRNTSTFKCTLAQWLATTANSMMFLGVGMMVAIPTVVIGVLHKSDSELSLNDNEASWFGSLMLLVQPAGCIAASFLQQYIGRKSGMILMNIPELISWVLLYTANSVNALYLSVVMMGVSAGFMEAPGLSYIGEISQPRIRGMLTSFANINVSVGMLVEFFLGSIVDWRTAVAISAIFPLISIMLIAFIPDSPVWLLGKGRKEDALQALRWLRGWVSEEKVKAEFEELCRYTEASKFSNMTDSKNTIYAELPTTTSYVCANGTGIVRPEQRRTDRWKVKISDMFRPAMMRPFRLVIGYQIFFHCAALTGLRCYMVEIFTLLKMPADPNWLVFGTSVVMIIGGVICISTVKYVGKRKLSLFSLIVCSLGCVTLAVYTFYKDEIQLPWIPMAAFGVVYLTTMVGIGPIPWMLISEVFPVRGRSFGAGFSAALFYIIAFLFSKTYLDLEKLITLPGSLLLYGVGGLLGVLFLLKYLPETEGKTLEEVEDCFRKNRKKPIVFNS